MRRIDADLEGLQPVAVPQALEGEAVARRRDEGVERRQGRRHRALGAEPGEDDAGADLRRIAALADPGAQGRAGRLGRRLEAACRRRRTSSRGTGSAGRRLRGGRRPGRRRDAGRRGRSGPSDPAPSRNSTRSWPRRRTAFDRARGHARVEARIELVDQRRRLPVAAHQVAAGRARADARDQFVLLGLHGVIAATGRPG